MPYSQHPQAKHPICAGNAAHFDRSSMATHFLLILDQEYISRSCVSCALRDRGTSQQTVPNAVDAYPAVVAWNTRLVTQPAVAAGMPGIVVLAADPRSCHTAVAVAAGEVSAELAWQALVVQQREVLRVTQLSTHRRRRWSLQVLVRSNKPMSCVSGLNVIGCECRPT